MEYGVVIGAFAVLTLNKVSMPVLVLGSDIYPALGGDYPGNFALS